jgi:hypothetical protein
MSYEQEIQKSSESFLQMTCQATHCIHNTLRRTHKPNCDVGYIELDDHGICIHFSKEVMPCDN